MLMEIGVVNDPSKTGFYSGCIESIFALGQLITGKFRSNEPHCVTHPLCSLPRHPLI